jgi:predicted amidophosphoribosyltransferase
MKDASPEDKFENMLGAFAILDDTAVRKKLVIIVDDLYYSGTTLMELASTLNGAGATVQGLVATKATRR